MHAPGRLRAFAYVTADKAPLYRAVMRVFVEAKASFTLHLRPQDVVAALPEPLDLAAVEAALASLREWGNLEAHPDTADVATVEEFYRPRYLFQLTPEGEAAERALAAYEAALGQRGELQTAALSDIGSLLAELAALGDAPRPDEAKVHRTLRALRDRFEELTARAQAFMSSLQRTIDLQGVDVPRFLAYKETLIGYLERFIGELVIAAAEIGATIRTIEARGIDALLELAAGRDLADALDPTPADHAAAHASWQARWGGLRSWFIGRPEAPAQAEVLRARARASIPALLLAVASIHDRRSPAAIGAPTCARWRAGSPRPTATRPRIGSGGLPSAWRRRATWWSMRRRSTSGRRDRSRRPRAGSRRRRCAFRRACAPRGATSVAGGRTTSSTGPTPRRSWRLPRRRRRSSSSRRGGGWRRALARGCPISARWTSPSSRSSSTSWATPCRSGSESRRRWRSCRATARCTCGWSRRRTAARRRSTRPPGGSPAPTTT